MKVRISLSLLFLFAFVFAAGLVTGDVAAGVPCQRWQCICGLYCSSVTGSNCSVPPYYEYQYDCQKKPGVKCASCDDFNNQFVGCCWFPE